MGIFSFLKPKSETPPNTYLILDLGTSAIKCLIVKNSITDRKGFIIGYGTHSLPPNSNLAGQILDIHAYTDAVSLAIDKAVNLAGQKPINTITGLAGPKIINHINQQKFTRSKPQQKITTDELQIIFRQIESQSRKIINSQQNANHVELINAAILKITIDDTEITNPLDFTGKDLNITYFVSYAPSLQLNALQSVIDECKLNLVSIINEPYSLVKSIDQQNYLYKNSLFIDIGDDLTNISQISAGQIIHVGSYQSGGRQFTNLLAENLSVSHAKAEQYKLDYCSELLSAETEKEFSQLFIPQAQIFLDNLNQYLSSQLTNFDINHIFISGGSSLLPEIKHKIQSELPKQKYFSNIPEIHHFSPIEIEDIVDKTGLIKDTTQITSVCLAKMGLNFSDQDSQFEKIVKKLMRTLRT